MAIASTKVTSVEASAGQLAVVGHGPHADHHALGGGKNGDCCGQRLP